MKKFNKVSMLAILSVSLVFGLVGPLTTFADNIPFINITVTPSITTPLPYGGDIVAYTYNVTNPSLVSMSNVSISDNRCSSISGHSGDFNGNNLLDPSESWVYHCQVNIPISTTSIITVQGSGNNFTANNYAFASVLVSFPGFPNTGIFYTI